LYAEKVYVVLRGATMVQYKNNRLRVFFFYTHGRVCVCVLPLFCRRAH